MKGAVASPAYLMALVRFFLLVVAPAGCAQMMDPGPPISQVLLNPVLFKTSAASDMLPQQVLVSRPTVADDLNTDRIAVLFNGLEVKYLARARWTASTPVMLQRLMVDSLESTGCFMGVGDEASGLTSQLRLSMDIKRFYLRYDNGSPPVAELMVTFRLVELRTGSSHGFISLQARENAKSECIKDLADAFDAVTGLVLSQASAWVTEKAEALR